MSENTPHWFKSSYSSAETGHCVEVAFDAPVVRVRDSIHPHREWLEFGTSEWRAFARAPRLRAHTVVTQPG
ncbi:DUF397 domain-containing protein [Nocardiopsis oceani]